MKSTLASARSTLLWIAIVTVVVVWVLRDLALLVGYAVLLAYALLPIVKAIERVRDPRGRHLPRGVVAGCVMLTLVAVVGWLVALAVPRIAAEAAHFASNVPEAMSRVVQNLRVYAAQRGLSAWVDPAIEGLGVDSSGLVQNLGGALAQATARLFGGIGHLLGFALLPLLAFYLLAESEAVQASALRFVPEEARTEITRLGGAVDRALGSYVRGQAIVCLVTGTAVGVALSLMHYPVALLLGLLAGTAELIPYLGFMVTAIAIGLAGSSVSPLQAMLGLAAYIGLNWAIGTFVTPRVMGRYLKMHPFVVTVSVLAGAQLMGPAGALLALPGAAVLQAVIGELAPVPSRAAKSKSADAPDFSA
jgi:predicted PurR-regulated permease PerM